MLSRSLVAFALVAISAHAYDLSLVKQAFDDANLPETLSLSFDPTLLLDVELPQADGTVVRFEVGEQLVRNLTVGPPTFFLEGDNIGDGPFVVAAVDPDAPTPQEPTISQVRHFLGGNFVRDPEVGSLVNTTPAISNWRQPSPPAGSDAHRYVVLVYEQPPEFNDQTLVNSTTPILQFNISVFGEAVGLGDPVAGTFFLVAPQTAA